MNTFTNAQIAATIAGLDKTFVYRKKSMNKAFLEAKLAELDKGAKDYVLFEPTGDCKPPRADTKRALVMSAMVKGVTINQIADMTGWARPAASAFFNEDVKKLGYGVRKVGPRAGAIYKLIIPKGASAPTSAA